MNIQINPPPRDAKCEVCGKHVSELEAFGGAGDPLVGDFNGAKLVKTFRAEARGSDQEFVSASWECRDCIVLDDEDYDKKRYETYELLRNSQ